MPQLIAWCVTALTVLLGIICILTREKRKQLPKTGTVQLPFGMALIGMIGGLILAIPAIYFSRDGLLPVLLFSVFILLTDTLMVGYINCVITYDSKGFTARNFFGICRSCLYTQVKGVREGKDCWVYFGNHRILVDCLSQGGSKFYSTLCKNYTAQTGKLLPEYPRRWDPMNGHVEYPWFYFIMWIVLALFCVGFMVLAVYCLTVETKMEDLIPHTVTFTDYKLDDHGKELVLYAPGYENPFRIGYYKDYGDDRITPEALCAGESYTAYTQREDRGHIYRLTDRYGTELITPEQERSIYRGRQMPAFILMLILSPLGVVFSIFGIILTRNPEKYPDWLKKLYYREGYLH